MNGASSGKRKLIILSGPTAAGKTELSLSLAERIGGEIVSADSMQVYRGMDTGTAKIRPEEMRGIRHHLINIISPFDEWSVSTFKQRALEAMEGIYERGHIPIVTGGTGFYIQALLYDIDFDDTVKECPESAYVSVRAGESSTDTMDAGEATGVSGSGAAMENDPEEIAGSEIRSGGYAGTAGATDRRVGDACITVDAGVRERLTQEYNTLGAAALHERLRAVDPVSAEIIHENNVKRVIRALEFYELTGRPISEHNSEQRQRESRYDHAYFVLSMDRKKLYERIDRRVDMMLDDGLVDEVKRLREAGLDRSYVSMQGLGYKEILAYLDGECTLEEAVRVLKRDTRHFAKRQLTWFRRERDVIMLMREDHPSESALLETILETLRTRGIL